MKSILSETSRTTKIIADLHSIIKYKDVLFYTWQTLMKILLRDKCSNSVYLLNVFELLQKIVPPKATRSSETTEYDKEIIGFTDGNICKKIFIQSIKYL